LTLYLIHAARYRKHAARTTRRVVIRIYEPVDPSRERETKREGERGREREAIDPSAERREANVDDSVVPTDISIVSFPFVVHHDGRGNRNKRHSRILHEGVLGHAERWSALNARSESQRACLSNDTRSQTVS